MTKNVPTNDDGLDDFDDDDDWSTNKNARPNPAAKQ